MVHSDSFTSWTVYEPATTREQLRTYFVGNYLSCVPPDANFLLIKTVFRSFEIFVFPSKQKRLEEKKFFQDSLRLKKCLIAFFLFHMKRISLVQPILPLDIEHNNGRVEEKISHYPVSNELTLNRTKVRVTMV